MGKYICSEKYWFPFGRIPFEKIERLWNDVLRLGKRLIHQDEELRTCHYHIDRLQKEIYDMQMERVKPVLEYIEQNMDIAMETVEIHDLHAQEFRVAVRTPYVRWYGMRPYETSEFTGQLIRDVSRRLADSITKYICKGTIKSK